MNLYPKYLNKGSHGAAVLHLQAVLQQTGYGTPGLVRDGKYGEETADSIECIQGALGIDADGNFGPATREAIRKDFDIDFDAIQAVDGEDTYWIGPEPVGANQPGTWYRPE